MDAVDGRMAPEMTDAMDRELNERERRILYFMIHKHIREREPVGSRTISKAFDFEMSPATVRNICSDLEEWGYLEQPHTSAGRQPTDKGYRLYVNELVRIQDVAERQRERIVREYNEKIQTLDEILQKTVKLLADASSHTSVVVYPDRRHVEVGRLSLMLDKVDVKDMVKLRQAMSILEEPDRVERLFDAPTAAPDGVDVRLGRELDQPELEEFSIVRAKYQVSEDVQGSFGVVGPKRMPYGRMISLVRTIRDAVNQAFGRLRRDR